MKEWAVDGLQMADEGQAADDLQVADEAQETDDEVVDNYKRIIVR